MFTYTLEPTNYVFLGNIWDKDRACGMQGEEGRAM